MSPPKSGHIKIREKNFVIKNGADDMFSPRASNIESQECSLKKLSEVPNSIIKKDDSYKNGHLYLNKKNVSIVENPSK